MVCWSTVLATMVGMCACVVAFLMATRAADTDIRGIAAGGAQGGALYGIITGVVLVRLLRNRLPGEQVSWDSPPPYRGAS